MDTPPLVNRVANSGLITLNLEDFFPKEELLVFDIKEYLFHGLILKEKDFREALKNHDWTIYDGKNVLITCSADAIVPMWAYQLIAVYIEPYCKRLVYGANKETFYTVAFHDILGKIDIEAYRNQRIVIKGCGELPIPIAAYTEIARILRPVASSIMYGEPCSTVPLYKKGK